ncbi:MAG: polysaccharide deacetylase family protein [Armatimonadota bacterium]
MRSVFPAYKKLFFLLLCAIFLAAVPLVDKEEIDEQSVLGVAPAAEGSEEENTSLPTKNEDLLVPNRYRGCIVRQKPRGFNEPMVALTFDDGPDPIVTPKVLEILKKHDAKATFFVIGKHIRLHPNILKQVVADGHAIGNHSFSHSYSISAEGAAEDIDSNSRLIRKVTGLTTTLFRPPGGFSHGRLARAALGQGYTAVLWTISSADSARIPARLITNNVLHTPHPGDIILMHDGPGHLETVHALPQILENLRAAGFRLVTVPELLRAWDLWERERGLNAERLKHPEHDPGAVYSTQNHHIMTLPSPGSGAASNSTAQPNLVTSANRHR